MNEDSAALEIKSLRDSGSFDAAVKVGYEHLKTYPNSWKVRGALAWSVYRGKVKDSNFAATQPGKIAAAVREIYTLTEHQPYGEISAYLSALFAAVSLLEKDKKYEIALSLLDEVDPTKLTTVPSTYKEKRMPGQLEKWYLALSKALAGIEEWERLASVCSDALTSGVFESDEDKLWLRYRFALALVDVDPLAALALIDEVKKFKNESWLLRQRAKCFYNLGRVDEALQECRVALGGINLKKPEFAMKILEDIYNYSDDVETRVMIIQSLRAIRLKNGWPIRDDYEKEANNLGCENAINFPFVETIKKFADSGGFHTQKKETANGLDKDRRKPKGPEVVIAENAAVVIKRFLPSDQNIGFAKTKEHGDVLVKKFDNPELLWPPVIGSTVTGRLIETIDRKKNRKGAKLINAQLATPNT